MEVHIANATILVQDSIPWAGDAAMILILSADRRLAGSASMQENVARMAGTAACMQRHPITQRRFCNPGSALATAFSWLSCVPVLEVHQNILVLQGPQLASDLLCDSKHLGNGHR